MYTLLLPLILMQGPKIPEPKLTALLTPKAVQLMAWEDLQSLPPEQRLLTRYIYDPKGGVDWVKSQSANLNRISRSSLIFRPVPMADNRLLRVDLSAMVFDLKELTEVLDTWELLRFDPTMNLLLTKSGIRIVLSIPENQRPHARVREGKVFADYPLHLLKDVDVVRINAQHLNPNITNSLQLETFSAAPVISSGYFETRALSTIQDKGAFKVIWGGLYYQFNGIKKNLKKGTDEDLFFESLGVGDIAAGITAQKIYDRLRSEQRLAMFRSDVTGKPRQIDFLPTLNRRIGDGVSAVSVTHDIKDEDIDQSQHAIYTLRKAAFKDNAREVVFIKANGFNGYVLFNNKGELQDEVPFDVAGDSTVPNPHTKRLQCAISCIRCHEVPHSGWIPARNDVMTLLEKGLDVFGDVSDLNRPVFETIRELSAQYKGRPDRFFAQARNSFQVSMLEATGAWIGSPTAIVGVAGKHLQTSFNEYNYERVTPVKALRELGFESVPATGATKFLQGLLKPSLQDAVFGIIPEDPVIFALTHDLPIYRKDFAMIHAFAQFRAQRELQKK